MVINICLTILIAFSIIFVYEFVRFLINSKRTKAKRYVMISGIAILLTFATGASYLYYFGFERVIKVSSEIYTIGKDAVYMDETLIVMTKNEEVMEYEFPNLDELQMTSLDIEGVQVEVAGFTLDIGILRNILRLEDKYAIKILEEE